MHKNAREAHSRVDLLLYRQALEDGDVALTAAHRVDRRISCPIEMIEDGETRSDVA